MALFLAKFWTGGIIQLCALEVICSQNDQHWNNIEDVLAANLFYANITM